MDQPVYTGHGVCIDIARVIYLQVVNHDRFTTMSQDNRIELATVVPVRGNIYDRKGRLIAMNSPVYNLEVIPAEVDDFNQMISSSQTDHVNLSDDHIDQVSPNTENSIPVMIRYC